MTWRMLKRVLLLLMLMVIVQLPASAAMETGIEARFLDGNFSVNTVKLGWEASEHWTVQSSYQLDNQDLSVGLVYNQNPDAKIQSYLGLGVRDLLGESSDSAFLERTEVIAGVKLDLDSSTQTRVNLTVEAKVIPGTAFNNSNSAGLDPIVSVALNFRLPQSSAAKTRVPEKISDRDFDLLSRLVMAEAGGESFEGKVAVAAVILNRVRSYRFPNTIREVIYQRGQFSSVPKLARVEPSESCRKAVVEAVNGSDPSQVALFFYNPRTCSKDGLEFFTSGRLKVTARIGNHVFLRY